MLGVSIDDVWSQPSLVDNNAPTKRNSKYTRMVNDQPTVPMGGPKGFAGPGGHDGGYRSRGGYRGERYGSPPQTTTSTTRPQIEGPMVSQPSFPIPVTGMVSALPSKGSYPQVKEIPYLRERFTPPSPPQQQQQQQSNHVSKEIVQIAASRVSECQKEVHALRSVVSNLSNELKHQKRKNKSKSTYCLYMILQIGLLLFVVVLLAVLMQKVNRLLNSQLSI